MSQAVCDRATFKPLCIHFTFTMYNDFSHSLLQVPHGAIYTRKALPEAENTGSRPTKAEHLHELAVQLSGCWNCVLINQ